MSIDKKSWLSKFIDTFRVEEAPAAKKDKANEVRRVGLVFTTGGASAGATRIYEPPTFDLNEVTRAYNTEAYVRQALDKYVDLMFKAGWDLDGTNINAVEYVKIRLNIIGMMTGVPMDEFFIEVAEDLVKYHNVFIVKVRDKEGSGSSGVVPGVAIRSVVENQGPIAGYFLLNPTTIAIARDKHGHVLGYEQTVPGEDPVNFRPEDIIHIYYKKDRGFAFGSPFLLSVVDDIKALREAEENVLRLLYKHIFPFYVYTVGLPEPGFEATDEEIDEVREKIADINLDGGLILPERHSVDVVGVEGEAIKADSYLEYFEKRVFTGLGVSAVSMGRADTSNRSTADAMTLEMHDRIKAFQRVMSIFVDTYIINELLMEGGFDHLSNPDDDVDFKFNEIELESKIKLENHAVYLYEHHAITEDEMRKMLGLEEVAEREKMYVHLVKEQESVAEGENKEKPENQHTKRSAPKKRSEKIEEHIITTKPGYKQPLADLLHIKEYASMLEYHWELTKDDVIDAIKHYYLQSEERELSDFKGKMLEGILHLTKESMHSVAGKYARIAFIRGVDDARNSTTWTKIPEVNYLRYTFRLSDVNTATLDRLMNDLLKHIAYAVKMSNKQDAIARIVGAFTALSYRLDFIANTEMMKAYNYGYAAGAHVLDRNELQSFPSTEEPCLQCQQRHRHNISLAGDFYDGVPPFHPNCSCQVQMLE